MIQVKKFIRRPLNRIYGNDCSIFRTLEVILSRSKVSLPRYKRKHSFAGFKTKFTSFAVLILALWRLFRVDQRYHCQGSGENVQLPALKSILRLSLFYIQQFGGYFEMIEDTTAKIGAKTFICRFLNRFYGICSSIFSTLEVIFTRSKIPLPKYGQKRSFVGGTSAKMVAKTFIFRL